MIQKSAKLLSRFEYQIGLALILGLLVLIGLGFYADFQELRMVLVGFDWSLAPMILGLTVLNYLLRIWRWQHFLKVLDIQVDRKLASLVFLSGMAMTVTPGRIGELVKSFFLKRLAGIDMSRSAPLVVFERLSDGLAMLVLMSGGFFLTQYGLPAILVSFVIAVGFIFVLHQRALVQKILDLALHVPVVSRYFGKLNNFYTSSRKLVGWKSLLIGWLLSLAAWASEAYGFYLVLVGLGAETTLENLLLSVFIFGFAAIAGFLTLLPGGIGIAEGTMTGLVLVMIGLSKSVAAAGALLGRLFTLWFGVMVGIVAVVILQRMVKEKELAGEK